MSGNEYFSVTPLPESSSPFRRISLTDAADAETERYPFVYRDIWPEDVISLISGKGGEGKSTWVLHKAAQASRGLLPGDYEGTPLTVAVSAIEDNKSLQRLRLEAARADLRKVKFLDVSVGEDDATDRPRIPEDLPILRSALRAAGVKIWVIDPITDLVEGDTNSRDHVRETLEALARLAADLHLAIVGIAHFNKGGGDAGDKISGSHAFRDVCRSHLPVALDEESGHRIITLEKGNYSTLPRGTSWGFKLEDAEVTTTAGQVAHVGRVFELGESSISVTDIINKAPTTDNDGTKAGEAEEWLRDLFKSTEGAERDGISKKEIEKAAEDDGYKWRTVQRAKAKIGIESIREGGVRGAATWFMPDSEEARNEDKQQRDSVVPKPNSVVPNEVGTTDLAQLNNVDMTPKSSGVEPSCATRQGLAQLNPFDLDSLPEEVPPEVDRVTGEVFDDEDDDFSAWLREQEHVS